MTISHHHTFTPKEVLERVKHHAGEHNIDSSQVTFSPYTDEINKKVESVGAPESGMDPLSR